MNAAPNTRSPVHGDAAWNDPAPPSLDCLTGHLGDLADLYGQLAKECLDLQHAIGARLPAGRKPTKAQLHRACWISGLIDAEYAKRTSVKELREIGKIGDALYFDAVRLDGSTAWDEAEQSWELRELAAHRKEAAREPAAPSLSPEPVAQESSCEPAAPEDKREPTEALEQATAIARSASLDDIDWTPEPLSHGEGEKVVYISPEAQRLAIVREIQRDIASVAERLARLRERSRLRICLLGERLGQRTDHLGEG